MKYINPMYLTQKVRQFVFDLISEYGYKGIDDLPDSDRESFAAYLIDASEKDFEHEFLTESPHLDQTIGAFKKSLMGFQSDDRYFLEILKSNTVNYFYETMQIGRAHV